MANFNIETMKAKLINIARPTLFDVTMTGPAGWTNTLDTTLLRFTCKNAQLPDATVGKIEVPFFGRKVQFAGDRQYQDWSTSIILDGDYKLYKQLITWQNIWNDPITNTGSSRNMNDYKANAKINVYDNLGNSTMVVNLVGVFPYQVNQLDLNWESTDSYAELSVQFFLDYYTVETE